MRKPKTLTELIEGLTWFNDIEKTKEILRKLVAGTSGGKTYLEEGTNITLVGEGTEEDPIIISSTGGGGTGAVDSVFGRTGAVTAQTGDYTVGQITNAQETLVSGTNIKTVNGETLLGSTDIEVQAPLEVYSESGTLAGGDAVATIGSIDQNTGLGQGLIYFQNLGGGGYSSMFLKADNMSIVAEGAINPLGLISRQGSVIFSTDPMADDSMGLDFSNVTGIKTQSFQNKSGTIALLPTSQGTAGQFLQTDGNDNVVWATPSGGGGGTTNLGYTPSTNQGTVTSSTGTSATLPLFSTGVAGLVPARVGSVTTKFLREDGTWVTPTNTTYGAGTLAILNTGTSTTTSVYTPKDLNDWLVGKSYATQTSLATVLPINTANTNTTISLTTSGGNLCNMGSANSNTTYTTTGTVLNAYAKVLINAATEPVVTGATKIKGATFTASTNMYMIVNYTGASRGVEYYFLEI